MQSEPTPNPLFPLFDFARRKFPVVKRSAKVYELINKGKKGDLLANNDSREGDLLANNDSRVTDRSLRGASDDTKFRFFFQNK